MALKCLPAHTCGIPLFPAGSVSITHHCASLVLYAAEMTSACFHAIIYPFVARTEEKVVIPENEAELLPSALSAAGTYTTFRQNNHWQPCGVHMLLTFERLARVLPVFCHRCNLNGKSFKTLPFASCTTGF